MVAHSKQRYSLIILQLITILNPYGSKLFFRLNGQMWLMVKLSAELDIYLNGKRLWQTIKFNSSTGKELLTLNNSRVVPKSLTQSCMVCFYLSHFSPRPAR